MGRSAGGCWDGSNLLFSGDVQEVLKSRSGGSRSFSANGILGSWPGANASLVNSGGSLKLGPLSPGPGGIGDLRIGELDSLGSSESLSGVDGVLVRQLVVVSTLDLLLLSLLASLARQAADVGELSLLALRVDVAVLAAGDAVDAASLLSERSVLGDVAKGEAAIGVLVRVVLGGLDGLLAGLGRDALALLGLISGSGGLDTSGSGLGLGSAGNVGWVSSAASGRLDGGFSDDRGLSGCGSGCSSRLLNDEWSLGDKYFLFRESSARLFLLLEKSKQKQTVSLS